MSNASETKTWPALSFRDADAMIEWLKAVGFVEHATFREEHDPAVVAHAEWLWPDGGGILSGSGRPAGGVSTAGGWAVAVVTADPDAAFARAVAAGASVVRAMVDQDYGGRGGTVADPEGNSWSFGDYQPG